MIEPTEPTKSYKDILTEQEKLELLEKLGTVNLDGAIDIEHRTARLTEDDVWRMMAMDAYKDAIKHPLTGELHRDDASVILGFLNKLTDETIAKEFKNRIGHRSHQMTDARSVFARMLEILVARRGLQSLVKQT